MGIDHPPGSDHPPGGGGTTGTAWLTRPEAQPVLEAARTLAPTGDPLTAGAALRRAFPGVAPEHLRSALAHMELEARARTRHGRPDAQELRLTRDGLEQGTRADVAERRARLVRDSGARRVLDLTAGLGFDALAFARAGLHVIAVERDAEVASLLAYNLRGTSARIIVGEAIALAPELMRELTAADLVFADPARRDPSGARDLATGRARAERDPMRWSPPLPDILGLDHPRMVIKGAPALEPPPGWQAEWVSVDRTVVECCLWSWPVATGDRRAIVLRDSDEHVVTADERTPIATAVGDLVLAPDPAVVRAGLLDALGSSHARLDPESTWLTGDAEPEGTLASVVRGYRVICELPGRTSDARADLRERGIARAIVMSRDTGEAPARVLTELRLREGGDHVLVRTRRAGRTVTLLTRPVP